MAIRLLRTYELECDKCGKIIGRVRAFSNSEEDEILANLVCLCLEDCKTKGEK